MKSFAMKIDDTMDKTLNDLKSKIGKTSRANTFRLAIALLKITTDAKDDDLSLALIDKNKKLVREIIIPGINNETYVSIEDSK